MIVHHDAVIRVGAGRVALGVGTAGVVLLEDLLSANRLHQHHVVVHHAIVVVEARILDHDRVARDNRKVVKVLILVVLVQRIVVPVLAAFPLAGTVLVLALHLLLHRLSVDLLLLLQPVDVAVSVVVAILLLLLLLLA
uniref:(northern house mosquito) hypothetical protein n=1 Tax=Culex pipiens TaxID=7175 RepID=A0A8D8HGJ4_CULPI